MRRLAALVLLLGLAACQGQAGTSADARTAAPDARAASPDAAGPTVDASGRPLAGFGTITGMCGVLDDAVLTGTSPDYVEGDLDFATMPYVDPDDRDQLSPGGQRMIATPNAGGSSILSEVFAYEVLYRCDLADLVATETEVQYTDPNSKKADFLASIGGHPIGVSVTRAVTYPFGDPYTLDAATTLVTRKLDDIAAAQSDAVPADAWGKSLVFTEAYDAQAADIYRQAWDALDPSVKRDSIMVTFITDGDDLFIYNNQ